MFGQRCTYPTLVVGPDDTLYLTCRESNTANRPWVVNLYTKRPGGDWKGPTCILHADEAGYAHFQEALAWGPGHRMLHLSTHMYGGKPGRSHTVGYMRSRDFGKTWEGADGKRIELPVTSKAISVIASNRTKVKGRFRCGSIAVDAHGTPHVLYSEAEPRPSRAWIATPGPAGKWRRRPLLGHVTKVLPNWCVIMPGGITIGDDGRVFVTLTAEPVKPDPKDTSGGWGSPSWEVLWLESSDGGEHFAAKMVSKLDPTCPHWLPSIERPTGHNRVGVPGLIYTAGTPGKKNKQIVSNEVYWIG
jgi:hypothetical protein